VRDLLSPRSSWMELGFAVGISMAQRGAAWLNHPTVSVGRVHSRAGLREPKHCVFHRWRGGPRAGAWGR